MRKDPARSIQPTLANLLTQTDRAIEYADAQVTAALERRDAAAARRALDAVHEYRDFRERVLYVINGWTQLRLPPEERTSAKIAEIVRRAKATVRDPSTAPDSPV